MVKWYLSRSSLGVNVSCIVSVKGYLGRSSFGVKLSCIVSSSIGAKVRVNMIKYGNMYMCRSRSNIGV